MNDIKEWSESFAKYTWDRLGFVYHNEQAKLQETTITDDLVFQISKLFSGDGSLFMLEHAKNEKRNGNDLEFAIAVRKDEFLIFPIQAKRLYAKQRYPRISHKGQLKGLMNYAKEVGGVPLYLLYNYVAKDFEYPKYLCGKELVADHYGCTLVAAEHIEARYANKLKRKRKKIWKIPTFFSLLEDQASFPWHLLFYEPEKLVPGYKMRTKESEIIIKAYSKDELLSNKDWQYLTQFSQVQNSSNLVMQDFTDSVSNGEDNSTFSPRFRFIFDSFSD
ncbi:DUF6615 family protein [Pontibacter vulgaris]|uniref:DUF6615 family protein n=1 Tax=Pontibacter vulgaris TaxID=2905679 RepID=UPI001FA77B3C|nr:DUF6615 family protein [Pontibacter vulgaris]